MGVRFKTVFRVGEAAVAEGVPRAFLGVPIIIDEEGQPDRHLFEYFLSRRNGDWSAYTRVEGRVLELSGRTVTGDKLSFLMDRAYQLNVFRRWCRFESVDWRDVNDQELRVYAEALEEGIFSRSGPYKQGGEVDPLEPSSVNQYLTSAIDFLRYAVERGWRANLALKYRRGQSPENGRRGRGKGVGRTKTSARPKPALFRRTNPKELRVWYSEEDIKRGLAEFETAGVRLAAHIMYDTGLRIAEALSLTLASFPTPEQFRSDAKHRFIRVRGKGRKWRSVSIEEPIVLEVDRYKRYDRTLTLRKNEPDPDVLIIGETGNGVGPLWPRYVQKEFARIREGAGIVGVTPHILRHHYAAHTLLRSWRRRSAFLGIPLEEFDTANAQGVLSQDIIRLKENLGHASLDTTFGYLGAVMYLLGSALPIAYSDELDELVE